MLLVLRNAGIIGDEVFSFLVLVMFGYLLVMPSLSSFATGRALRSSAPEPDLSTIPPNIAKFVLMGILVDDILDRAHHHPPPSLTVRDFTESWANRHQDDYVVAEGHTILGLISVRMLRYVPEDNWGTTRLQQLVRSDYPVAWPDEHVEDVLERMQDHNLTVIPVLDRETGRFVGSVSSNDIRQLVLNRGRA